jgi:hypothetical protein
MARLFRVNQFEARKRALVAESEVYRQALKVEVLNLRLYGHRWKRRLGLLSSIGPLLMAGVPLARSVLRRRQRFSWPRLAVGLLIKSGLHRQIGPWLNSLIGHWQRPPPPTAGAGAAEEAAPGANV